MRLFVCKKNREGKSNLKMKGGKRNQIKVRIYAPVGVLSTAFKGRLYQKDPFGFITYVYY